jgi:hypothetical protein
VVDVELGEMAVMMPVCVEPAVDVAGLRLPLEGWEALVPVGDAGLSPAGLVVAGEVVHAEPVGERLDLRGMDLVDQDPAVVRVADPRHRDELAADDVQGLGAGDGQAHRGHPADGRAHAGVGHRDRHRSAHVAHEQQVHRRQTGAHVEQRPGHEREQQG